MATVDVDVSAFREFFSRIGQAASGDFRHEMELFLEGLGNEFLRVLQDEIIRRKVMDTRQLLASFEKGSQGNIWELTEGDLTLEVGTNVEYASYVMTATGQTRKASNTALSPATGRGTGGLFMTRLRKAAWS